MLIKALYLDFFINFILSLKLEVWHVTQLILWFTYHLLFLDSFTLTRTMGYWENRHNDTYSDFWQTSLQRNLEFEYQNKIIIILCTVTAHFYSLISSFSWTIPLGQSSSDPSPFPIVIKVWGLGLENSDRLQHLFQLLTYFLKTKLRIWIIVLCNCLLVVFFYKIVLS